MKWRAPAVIAALSLLGFLILGFGNVLGNSPTVDEAPHLAAGWTALVTGDFRLNTEHPPLLKMIAALPLLSMPVWPAGLRDDGSPAFASLRETWIAAPAQMFAQWFFADRWLYARHAAEEPPTTSVVPQAAYRNDPEKMFLLARGLLLVIIGCGLALLIFLWSRELWGLWGAALSAALFCFDPNFVAHSSLVTTDSGLAVLMFGAMFFFWKLTRSASPAGMVGFVVFFALAMLAKFSAVLLIPIALVLILISARPRRMRLLLALGIAMAASWVAVWAAYGFRFHGSDRPMPVEKTVLEWYAKKQLLERFPEGIPATELRQANPPDRIGWLGRSVLFANRHRLVPEAYLAGFAQVQSGAVWRESYLHGKFSQTGFRSYFFWTFLYKTPIAVIVAIVAAVVLALRRRSGDRWFLLVPVGIYLAVSVFSNLNIGHRHLLPVYPFLYVLCGALSRRWLVAPALAAVSCLVVFAPFQPVFGQHLAYFNELAGGPTRASARLLDSNLDWGQDVERLAQWIRREKIEEPINLVSFGPADPSYYGIRYLNIEGGFYGAPEVPIAQARIPGWFAISVNDYAGLFQAENRGRYRRFLEERGARVVDRAGYGMLIFRIE